MFTGNHKVVATHLMMARFKPAEGGTEHDGRSCNEQRCQSAKKKKVPSSSQNKHQQQERRYKDKLNKPSFRLVSDMFTKVWKKFEYLSCKPL